MQDEINYNEPRKIECKMASSFCVQFSRKQAQRVSASEAFGKRLKVIRCEGLGMELNTFAASTLLDEKRLDRIESGMEDMEYIELKSIAKIYPEYVAYLLAGVAGVSAVQKNPEVEILARRLGISGSQGGELIAQQAHDRWFRNAR